MKNSALWDEKKVFVLMLLIYSHSDGGMEGWSDGGKERWREGEMEGWREGGKDGWSVDAVAASRRVEIKTLNSYL